MPPFKRSKSSIIDLRIFHNWIKNEMFINISNKIRKNNPNKDITILELAVGRAGDLYKWIGIRAKEVIGIDIDKDAIYGKDGAYHRYRKILGRKKFQSDLYVPKCTFYVYDISDPKNLDKLRYVLKDKRFDIVSCQFAIHYFFRDIIALNTFLTLVDTYISPDGYFIGSTMDGNMIRQKLNNDNSIKNTVFHIKYNDSKENDEYGNTYTVTLGEKDEDHYFAQNASTEYLVDINELTKKASTYNLNLLDTKSFQKWYESYEEFKPTNTMSKDEKEFSFLNFSFIFQSTKPT